MAVLVNGCAGRGTPFCRTENESGGEQTSKEIRNIDRAFDTVSRNVRSALLLTVQSLKGL